MTSHRDQLIELLTPIVPNDWRVVPRTRTVDFGHKPTLLVKAIDIVKTPQAPQALWTLGFTLTLVSSYRTDLDKAEDELDKLLPPFLHSLATIPHLKWSDAKAVAMDENEDRIGWDVSITLDVNNTD